MKLTGTRAELEELADALQAMEVLAHEFAYGEAGDDRAKALWGKSSARVLKLRHLIPEGYRAPFNSPRFLETHLLEPEAAKCP